MVILHFIMVDRGSKFITNIHVKHFKIGIISNLPKSVCAMMKFKDNITSFLKKFYIFCLDVCFSVMLWFLYKKVNAIIIVILFS